MIQFLLLRWGFEGPFRLRGRLARRPYALGLAMCIVVAAVPLHGGMLAPACGAALLCLLARRLHDVGLSGWWALAPLGIWAVHISVLIVLAMLSLFTLGRLWPALDWFWRYAWTATLSFSLLSPLVMAIVPGSRGANRYGPPPGDQWFAEDTPADADAAVLKA